MNEIDLRPALDRIHDWAFKDPENGYLYWFEIAELLRSAEAMRVRLARMEQSALGATGSSEASH